MPQTPPHPDDDLSRLLAHLESHGGDCPACGYSLSGLSSPRCPECGNALVLRIGVEGLPLGPLLTLIVIVAMAGGFDLVAAALIPILWQFLPPRLGTEGVWIFAAVLLALAGLAAVFATVVLSRRRKSWARLTRQRAWTRALALGLLVVVAHGVFGAMMLPYV